MTKIQKSVSIPDTLFGKVEERQTQYNDANDESLNFSEFFCKLAKIGLENLS